VDPGRGAAPPSCVAACPECDLLQTIPELTPGARARCVRCGCTLAVRVRDPIERPLALTLTALVMLVVANISPLMGLSVVGRFADTTILGGAWQMWVQGEPLTAMVVAFCATLAPAGYIVFLLTVLLAVAHPPAPPWVADLLRWADAMRPWAMIEVMMLGILVALVKIAELATVEAGLGMYAMGALVALFPAIAVSFDPEAIWERVAWVDGRTPPSGAAGP
jgi:paraquat-inducible protein A